MVEYCPSCGVKLKETNLRKWCMNCGWEEFIDKEENRDPPSYVA
jgi:predicted RNA-binding Zn-ribbon protein involved in translation (DUF1610 family)